MRLAALLLLVTVLPWGAVHATPPHLQGVDDAYDEGTNTDKRPFKRGQIKVVAISGDGRKAWDGQPTPDDCKGFVPDAPMLHEYFKRAEQVSAHEYRHGEAPWSHCQASGSFTFVDGRRGGWAIQQHGLGYLVIGSQRVYLYCEACALTGFGAPDLVQQYQDQDKK